MTGRPTPSFASSVGAVFRLQWLRQKRGNKVRLAVISVGLIWIAGVLARFAEHDTDPVATMRATVAWGFFSLLVFFLPFLFTASAIAEEVESRTFSYLAARPAGRFAVAFGKYAAGMTLTILLLAGGILLLHGGMFATDPTALVDELPATLRAAGALMALSLFYGAVCLFWGALLPEAAGILSAVILAIDFGVAWMPGIFRLVSINYLGREVAGLPREGMMVEWIPDVPLGVSVGAPLGLAVLILLLAGLVVQSNEYRYGKA